MVCMFSRTLVLAVAAWFGLSSAPSALATPLRMDYSVSVAGVSSYRYDFTLTLDNHDGSWVSGQQWDWIIFGDNDWSDTKNGFDVNGSATGGLLWTTFSFAPPITAISNSGGGHNGPTLYLASDGPVLPGWQPASVGESLTWSGSSSVLIPNGELFWSALTAGGGAEPVLFELAHSGGGRALAELANPVPEPVTLTLVALGLAGLGFSRRTRAAN